MGFRSADVAKLGPPQLDTGVIPQPTPWKHVVLQHSQVRPHGAAGVLPTAAAAPAGR